MKKSTKIVGFIFALSSYVFLIYETVLWLKELCSIISYQDRIYNWYKHALVYALMVAGTIFVIITLTFFVYHFIKLSDGKISKFLERFSSPILEKVTIAREKRKIKKIEKLKKKIEEMESDK